MILGRKPYKVYMDEDGYRFSCRVKDCTDGGGHWLNRDDAETAAKDHHDKTHVERDKELEDWVEALCGDESQ